MSLIRRDRTPAEASPKPLLLLYGFLGACLVAYLVSEIVRTDGQSWPLVDGWGVAALELAASALCIARGFVAGRIRMVPLVLGLGLVSWSIGDLVLTVESAGGSTPSTPSLADAFYLAFYPLTYAGVLLLVRWEVRRLTAATWLDGAVAGLGAAGICAQFALAGLSSSWGDSAASLATNLAYPVGDLLLLAVVVGGSTVLPSRRRARWFLLAGGYAINALGDTANLFHSSIGTTHIGTLFDAIAWPTSMLLVSVSVWLPAGDAEALDHEQPPGLVVPGVAAVAALLILVLGSVVGVDRAAFVLATVTLLLAGIRCALALVRLRSLTDERRGQAVTDHLTALGNRRALFELLERILAEPDGVHAGRELAFLFVDLNRFKEINDSFGHSVGDELLRQLGMRFKESLRSSDLLARVGGDEFAVVLLDADADYATMVAQRISTRLEEPFLLGSAKTRVSASIGIAIVPGDASTPHDLLHCADLAMYRAKREDKCFAIYQQELDGRANNLRLLEELQSAIEQRRQLEVHYQPQVELASGRVAAVEALARWHHPRLGHIPPLEFLPLAEDAGLMGPLTAMILDRALAQCARWQGEHRSLVVSVNISATNLLDPEFPQHVHGVLARHDLEPQRLVLEITETAAMRDVKRCAAAIDEIRELGVAVSVDDFGAGFTSLAYLSTLAVSELKLDRSFIHGLTKENESRDLALIRSTISLAHALGLRVVAEGVEDEGALELLTDLGCDRAQGSLISKPRPASELSLAPYGDTPERPAAAESPRRLLPTAPVSRQLTYTPLSSPGTA